MSTDEGDGDIEQQVTEEINGIESNGNGQDERQEACGLLDLCLCHGKRPLAARGKERLQHWHMVMGEESPVCVSLPF